MKKIKLTDNGLNSILAYKLIEMASELLCPIGSAAATCQASASEATSGCGGVEGAQRLEPGEPRRQATEVDDVREIVEYLKAEEAVHRENCEELLSSGYGVKARQMECRADAFAQSACMVETLLPESERSERSPDASVEAAKD